MFLIGTSAPVLLATNTLFTEPSGHLLTALSTVCFSGIILLPRIPWSLVITVSASAETNNSNYTILYNTMQVIVKTYTKD